MIGTTKGSLKRLEGRQVLRNELTFRSFSSPNITDRSLSMLPPDAHQRVDEWNRTAGHGFAANSDSTMADFRERPFEKQHEFLRLNERSDIYDDDDVTPWDSVSMMSSRSMLQQGTSIESTYGSRSNPNLRASSWGAESTRDSFHNGKLPENVPLRGRAGCSSPNARLMSCINSLDHLSKKLDSVSSLASEVEKFRWASRSSTSSDPPLEKPQPQSAVEWRVGNDIMKAGLHQSGFRRGSEESWGTDSGINSYGEVGYSQTEIKMIPPAGSIQARKLNEPRHRDLRFHQSSGDFLHQPHESLGDFNHGNLAKDKRSSNDLYNLPQDDFTKKHAQEQLQVIPFQQDNLYAEVYGLDDSFEYGTFNRAPPSVYDDDLYQKNGWFFLSGPPPAQFKDNHVNTHVNNHVNTHVEQLPENYQHCELSSESFCHPRIHNNNSNMYPLNKQGLKATNYGTLSETFLMPTDEMSPFCAALNATCAKSSVYNDQPSAFVSNALQTNEGKKQKSVRFSKTVQERIENSDSEIEDTTSIMKGGHEEEEKKVIQVLPNFSNAIYPDPLLFNSPGQGIAQPGGGFLSQQDNSHCLL